MNRLPVPLGVPWVNPDPLTICRFAPVIFNVGLLLRPVALKLTADRVVSRALTLFFRLVLSALSAATSEVKVSTSLWTARTVSVSPFLHPPDALGFATGDPGPPIHTARP